MNITAANSHCEHIPSDSPAHDEADCPGPLDCSVSRGLTDLLAQLEAGQLVIRRVQ